MGRTREVQITGLKELRAMSEKVAPKVAMRLARNSVHKTAGQVRNAMRKRAPRDDGTLRKAIHTKRRRGTPDTVVSDVRIAHGNTVKRDAWYWHFIEFGTVKTAAKPFIRPTVDEFEQQIPGIFRDEFGKQLERQLAKEAARRGVKQ